MISASFLLASLVFGSGQPQGSYENLNIAKTPRSVCRPLPLPLPSKKGYIVQRDDNDVTIAKKLGCTVKELRKANPGIDWNRLAPGNKLKVPLKAQAKEAPVKSGRKVKFVRNDVFLRRGPTKDDDAITKVAVGRVATVVSKSGEWVKVKFESGTAGWVREDMVQAISPTVKSIPAKLDLSHVKVLGNVKFIKTDVVVHSQPAAESKRVGKVEMNRLAKAIEIRGGWVKIALDGGTVGWVRSDMIVGPFSGKAPAVATRQVDPASAAVVEVTPAAMKPRDPARTAKIVITPPVVLPDCVKFIKDSVILRSGASLESARVGKIEVGRYAKVLSQKDAWFEVKFDGGTSGWVRADMVHTATNEEMRIDLVALSKSAKLKPPAANVNNLIATAKSNLGIRYVWGGTSRSGFDCSGFVGWVFAKHNIHLPRTALEQSNCGTTISRDNLRTGDLVFFHTGRGSRINHVGIYLGDNQFIHASSGGGRVRISDLTGFYAHAFAGAKRIAGASKALAGVGDTDMVKKVRKGQEFSEHDIEGAAKQAEEKPAKVTVGSDTIGD